MSKIIGTDGKPFVNEAALPQMNPYSALADSIKKLADNGEIAGLVVVAVMKDGRVMSGQILPDAMAVLNAIYGPISVEQQLVLTRLTQAIKSQPPKENQTDEAAQPDPPQ